LPGFKVGVCWQGGPTLKTEALHSIRLEQLAPLAAISGVSLVSLQKGAGGEQIESNRERVSMHVFDDLDQDAVLVDSAAIMQHLDLVITPDTTIAHLAGALGRPVWVLLPVGSDWRWLAGRTDSPWYPTMRLFQQKTFGDWAGVIEEVAEALRAKVGEDRR
jgi:ADP-heptose:LPS heptosyltransferase